MAVKLFELIEGWFGEIINKNVKNSTTAKISAVTTELDALEAAMERLDSVLDYEKDALDELAKSHGRTSEEYKRQKEAIKDTNKQMEEQKKKQKVILDELSSDTGISTDQLNDYIDTIRQHGEEAVNSGQATNQFKTIMSSASKALGFDIKALSGEFFTLAAIVEMTVAQLVRSNQFLVEQSRKTGGVINYKTTGFDAYGNNQANTGSLTAITAMNNISEEQFFESLQGFNKGKVIGQDYSKSASDIQRFAVAQGRLMKLYSVSSGDIERITSVSTQLYGVSIKQLNNEFTEGATITKKAGLNVQEYFKNLARASELIGETYIAGGTQGLEKLALFATRLNSSVDNLIKVGSNFKTISDIFTQQAKATNLGLSNYAAQAGQLFAKTQLGLYDQANKIAVTALSKDVKKYTDKNGIIDQRGIRALNELGYDKEYIQLIQRTIQAQKKLGISFEDLTDISKLSQQQQISYYAEMNRGATLTEKLNKLWEQLKTVILDPLAAVLGPALDIVINVLVITFQALYVALKPIIYIFQILGKRISEVSDFLAGITGMFEEKSKKSGISDDVPDTLFDAAKNLITSSTPNLTNNNNNKTDEIINNNPNNKTNETINNITQQNDKNSKNTDSNFNQFINEKISKIGDEDSKAAGSVMGAIIPGGIGNVLGQLLGTVNSDEIVEGLDKISELLHPLTYMIPIYGTISSIKDIWNHFFGEKKNQELKKIISNTQTNNMDNVYKTLNSTLSQRVVDPLRAEKAQEKILQKITQPIIHVEPNRLFNDARVKMSGL